ncbi:hypothetical protein V1291_002606 [Nitrobacteraceae bacterium AZCC 1564]
MSFYSARVVMGILLIAIVDPLLPRYAAAMGDLRFCAAVLKRGLSALTP